MPKVARADVVGSLLRPQYLLDARNAWRMRLSYRRDGARGLNMRRECRRWLRQMA